MAEIINQRLQHIAGVSLVLLMTLGISIHREEEMVMGLTIIVAIIMVGLVMPLFWIIGAVGSITYVGLNRMSAAFKEGTAALDPHLGFTMADGGDPIDKEKKE